MRVLCASRLAPLNQRRHRTREHVGARERGQLRRQRGCGGRGARRTPSRRGGLLLRVRLAARASVGGRGLHAKGGLRDGDRAGGSRAEQLHRRRRRHRQLLRADFAGEYELQRQQYCPENPQSTFTSTIAPSTLCLVIKHKARTRTLVASECTGVLEDAKRDAKEEHDGLVGEGEARVADLRERHPLQRAPAAANGAGRQALNEAHEDVLHVRKPDTNQLQTCAAHSERVDCRTRR